MSVDVVESIDFVGLFDRMMLFRTQVSLSWLEIISNGWPTSHRMHEEVRHPCLFGCVHGGDRTAHYVQCLELRSIVYEALGLHAPRSAPPIGSALSVAPFTHRQTIILYVMHHLYNTGKHYCVRCSNVQYHTHCRVSLFRTAAAVLHRLQCRYRLHTLCAAIG